MTTKPITQTNTGYSILAPDGKFWSTKVFPDKLDATNYLDNYLFYHDSLKYKIVKVQSTMTVIEE